MYYYIWDLDTPVTSLDLVISLVRVCGWEKYFMWIIYDNYLVII